MFSDNCAHWTKWVMFFIYPPIVFMSFFTSFGHVTPSYILLGFLFVCVFYLSLNNIDMQLPEHPSSQASNLAISFSRHSMRPLHGNEVMLAHMFTGCSLAILHPTLSTSHPPETGWITSHIPDMCLQCHRGQVLLLVLFLVMVFGNPALVHL